MAQPNNYILDLPNPMDTVQKSFNYGFNTAAQVEQVKLQKQQREQMQEDFGNVIKNPTYENFSNLKLKYPQQHEAIESAFKTMDAGDQQTVKSVASKAFAALDNGQPDIAKYLVSEHITAYENAGNTRAANTAKGYLKMINDNPDAAKIAFGRMWQIADDDSFKTFSEQKRANEMQPVELAQKQAQTNKTIAETGDIPLAAQDRRQGVINQQRDIDLENQYKQQQLFFEKNKPVSFGVDIKGRKYAVMPNGDARYVKDAQGNYITDVKSEKPMTATMQKELFETDDAIASSQSVISNLKEALRLSPISYDGLNADMRASLAGNLGLDKERSKNTAMLNNIMTSNALDALKSTFGAAPTEGERKILLDIQGSVNLPAKQREAIYERALQAANKRLTMNQKKAEAIRNGSYTSSEYNKSQSTQPKQGTKPAARSFFD